MNTHDFIITSGDTDGISFCKKDMKSFTAEEEEALLNEINNILPEKIKFESEGQFHKVLILKSKNYVLQEKKNDKPKVKGSSIKDPKKEIALKAFVNEIIDSFLDEEKGNIIHLYQKYCKEVLSDSIDVTRWSTKKSITSKVLEGTRKNETSVMDAIAEIDYQEGDKVRLYRTNEDKLCLEERYNNDHDKEHLLERIFKTLTIFENLLDITLFPDYTKKKYKDLLGEL